MKQTFCLKKCCICTFHTWHLIAPCYISNEMKLICCPKIEHLHCNNQITNQSTAKQPIPTTAHSEHSAHTLVGINLHTAHNTVLGSFCTQQILNKQPKSDKTDHEGWIYWSWSTLRCDLKPRSFKEAQVFLFTLIGGGPCSCMKEPNHVFAQMWRMAQHSEHKTINFWNWKRVLQTGVLSLQLNSARKTQQRRQKGK